MNFLKRIFNNFKEKAASSLKNFNGDYNVMLIAFSAWIILTAVMCWDYANDNFQIGHPASRDVKAIYDFTYIDEDATEKEKLKAAGAVDKVIVPDKTVTNSVTHSVELTFSKIAACRDRHRNSILKMSAAVDKPETAFPVFISADMFENILSLSDSSFELVRNTSKVVTRNIMNEGVDASDVNDKLVSAHDIDRIKDVVSHLELNEIEKMIVISVASSAVRPNKKLDWLATKDLQADKMSKIEPVSKFIPKGQIIIREGEIVTPIQLDIIKSMGGVSLSQAGRIKKIAAGGIGALVMLLLVYFGVKKYSPQVLSERRLLLLLAIIMIVSAIVFKAIAVVSDGDFNELCFYIMPVAASAVLIEMIAGSSVAFICTVILSTFVAVVSKNASASFTSLFTGIIAL
ncbi:MAG: hypothetical protein MJ234_05245, partial [bacterium]|nr:hypothetical protein [bacterium]